MHDCREEVQLVEGQRTVHRAAAKLAEIESEARFQDEQMRRLEAMPEVERPWTIAALSITDEAAVRPLLRAQARAAHHIQWQSHAWQHDTSTRLLSSLFAHAHQG